MNTESLIRMANQIAHNFGAYPADQQTTRLTKHLKNFWDKRMLDDLFAYIDKNGEGLEPAVKKAALELQAKH